MSPLPTHFIVKCEMCGTVLSQCRCMSCSKEVKYSVCDACLKRLVDSKDPVGEIKRALGR